MNNQRLRITSISATILALLSGSAAHAQDDDPYGRPTSEAAENELKQGNRYYRVQEFERAIDFYKSGAVLEEAPIFYFNLGQCHRQLGNYEKAIWYLERWISMKNPPEGDALLDTVRGLIREMNDELQQAAKTMPPIEPGPDGDGTLTTDIDTDTDTGDTSALGPSPERPDGVAPWYADRVGLLLAGGGTIFGIAGVVLHVNASALRGDADLELNATKREELRDKADSRAMWGTVVGLTGGALLIAGIIKLAITPSNPIGDAKQQTTLSVGPNWVAIRGRF